MAPTPPLLTPVSEPYWAALGQGRIDLQHCSDCGTWVFYPRVLCPHCGALDPPWETVSGDATLYSFTVAETPVSPDFAELDPLAIVELAEGVHIPTTIVDTPIERIEIGMALEPVFDHDTYDGVTLLRFRARG